MSGTLSGLESRALAEVQGELWRRGILDWMLRPHQRPLYEDLSRHAASADTGYVLCVARRHGKSTVLLLIAIERCQRYPNSVMRFVAPQLKDAREIAREVIAPLLLPAPQEYRPRWNSLDSFYLFANGSKIHINGANGGHEDDSRGRRADLCIVDEAGFIDRLPYLVADVLLPQLVEAQSLGKMILSSTPSESPAHPFQAYCEEARLQGRYSRYTLDDNSYLSEGVKAQIILESGGRAATTYRREFNAEFVVEESRAIVPEWGAVAEACCRAEPRDELYGHYDKYIGMDLGVVSYTVILYGYYHFTQAKIIIEREQFIRGPEVRSDRIAEMIRATEKALWRLPAGKRPYCRVSDNNNLILLNDLNGMHQLYIRPTSKDSLAAMCNELRLWVKAQRIIIDPSCKMLIGCLNSGIWTVKRDMWESSEAYGHYDAAAALMYLVRNVDESHNPIPAELGMSPLTQWINPAEIERRGQLQAKLSKLSGRG